MARRSVDPQEVLDELHTQLQPSQDIIAALNEVAGSPAGQFLKDDITRMSLVCGDNALQDGKREGEGSNARFIPGFTLGKLESLGSNSIPKLCSESRARLGRSVWHGRPN